MDDTTLSAAVLVQALTDTADMKRVSDLTNRLISECDLSEVNNGEALFAMIHAIAKHIDLGLSEKIDVNVVFKAVGIILLGLLKDKM